MDLRREHSPPQIPAETMGLPARKASLAWGWARAEVAETRREDEDGAVRPHQDVPHLWTKRSPRPAPLCSSVCPRPVPTLKSKSTKAMPSQMCVTWRCPWRPLAKRSRLLRAVPSLFGYLFPSLGTTGPLWTTSARARPPSPSSFLSPRSEGQGVIPGGVQGRRNSRLLSQKHQ